LKVDKTTGGTFILFHDFLLLLNDYVFKELRNTQIVYFFILHHRSRKFKKKCWYFIILAILRIIKIRQKIINKKVKLHIKPLSNSFFGIKAWLLRN